MVYMPVCGGLSWGSILMKHISLVSVHSNLQTQCSGNVGKWASSLRAAIYDCASCGLYNLRNYTQQLCAAVFNGALCSSLSYLQKWADWKSGCQGILWNPVLFSSRMWGKVYHSLCNFRFQSLLGNKQHLGGWEKKCSEIKFE